MLSVPPVAHSRDSTSKERNDTLGHNISPPILTSTSTCPTFSTHHAPSQIKHKTTTGTGWQQHGSNTALLFCHAGLRPWHQLMCMWLFLFHLCKLFLCAAKLEALGRKMRVPLSTVVRIAILLIDACGLGWHSASLLICVWGSNCIAQIGKIAMCQITLHRPISKIAMRAPQHRRARMSIFHLHFSILLMKSWNHALLFRW